MVNQMMESMPCKPRLCCMERGGDGYGFNLHGERGQHGQFIRAVDPDSPADHAGLKSGDRVIEVNGVNIERETHSQVVARIRDGGIKTSLLVVNKELDVYCRKYSITIKESMIEGGVDLELSPIVTNGEHEPEVHMNVTEDQAEIDNEVVVARIETGEEALPEREETAERQEESAPEREEPMQEPMQPRYDDDVEDHGYAEIQRRDVVEEETAPQTRMEEREEEEEEMFTAEAEMGEARTAEIKGVEEEVIQAQQNNVEESIPAPPQEREEEADVSVPEPDPEPILEAATVPVVASAPPPQVEDDTDGPVATQTKPDLEETPEPVKEPEPVKAPEPEPPAPVIKEPVRKTESAPPPRPTAAPTEQRKSEMEKARILAAGRRKKREASSKNWEDKYAAFNNL